MPTTDPFSATPVAWMRTGINNRLTQSQHGPFWFSLCWHSDKRNHFHQEPPVFEGSTLPLQTQTIGLTTSCGQYFVVSAKALLVICFVNKLVHRLEGSGDWLLVVYRQLVAKTWSEI